MWGSKKQKSVALSSCEAEIVAASEATKEGVYLKRLLEDLQLHEGEAVDLRGDNQAAIALSYNPEHHDKVKHVERRHFFIRETVEEGLLSVPYVKTVDNIADFFTKALPKETFFAMRDQIMNCDAHSSEEQRACIARGSLFTPWLARAMFVTERQNRTARELRATGQSVHAELSESSCVGRGGVVQHGSSDPSPAGKLVDPAASPDLEPPSADAEPASETRRPM